jgi:capsular exopolysaccharide synthesis family protein
MGRIAEALKKAQEERSRRLRVGGDPGGRGTGGSILTPDSPEGVQLRKALAPATRLGGDVCYAIPPNRGIGVSAPIPPRPAWDVHPTVVAAHDHSCAITEQYRAVRTWLLRRNATGRHECIAITSSIPREGKSVTTANLAVVMSEVRHMKVLAMDFDLRQGSLAKLYKLSGAPGLADVLAGEASLEEAMTTTPFGNLSFLPAGICRGRNPAELVNSKTAAHVFEEIRERFHFTLVDTPPVRRLSDVGVIGALCTGIVVIVRMNKTASHLVRQSLHWLQANNLDVIGCIAADCCVRGARYEYENDNDD